MTLEKLSKHGGGTNTLAKSRRLTFVGPQYETRFVSLTMCLEFFSLAPRFVENLCTLGVDSCQRNGCPEGPEGFKRALAVCTVNAIPGATDFTSRVPQLTYLQEVSLGEFQILSALRACFATNVSSDERLHVS